MKNMSRYLGLIFIGRDWKKLFKYLPKVMYKFDHDFYYFVNTLQELEKTLDIIKQKYE